MPENSKIPSSGFERVALVAAYKSTNLPDVYQDLPQSWDRKDDVGSKTVKTGNVVCMPATKPPKKKENPLSNFKGAFLISIFGCYNR
jgi:hypothetical protein